MEELKTFKDKLNKFAKTIILGMLLLLISFAIVTWSMLTLLYNLNTFPTIVSIVSFLVLSIALYSLINMFIEDIKMLSTLIDSFKLYKELKEELNNYKEVKKRYKNQIGVNKHEKI